MKDAGLSLEPALAQKLLEELIYQHVQTQVDLFKLGCFEDELDETIRRVLDGLDAHGAEPPSRVLAASLIDRAWSRLEDDWYTNRGAPDECPLCVAEQAAMAARRD